MYRTHTNGALNLSHKGERVELSGWVQGIRDKGFLMWIDLRDRYGITQLVLDEARTDKSLFEKQENSVRICDKSFWRSA